ncbi:hypothetical protein [Pseudorhodoferax sp. Leaf267]|uniref:GAP1-N1 domain-containing protein n=1 Tax=Pseudorhodoferax sp. Leaf267 TaxID=1736316 RepID=UPI0012E325E6|nr:hypothetical protein [Pseudorhodoferax sp. Leaf267]
MTVKVHQALHGYSHGHRQLACSVTLPTKDARLMLVMSDVSGPGVASLGLPYLTGYPLTESGLYALARTWPAPEMSRPGCVWTHTLLIGFADLATLLTPSAIAEFFERPTMKGPLDAFSADFLVKTQDHIVGPSLSSEATSWFARLAGAVYEHPDVPVWARRAEGEDIEDAVLRLWDQQWPRLRRSFRFCTLTSRDRSQDGMPFDLQLTSGSESSSHLRFSSTVEGFEASSESTGPWLDDLVHDARFPHASTLRPFLRKLGADMLGGREAMRPFCSLHAALEATDAVGVSEAVARVEASPVLATSDLVKSIVVQAAMPNLTEMKGQVLDFVIENVSLLPGDSVSRTQGQLAKMLWERDPRRLLELSSDSRQGVREAIRAGAAAIPVDAVIEKLPEVSDFAELLLTLLPATAEAPEFWSSTNLPPSLATRAGVDLSDDAVLRAMMLGLRATSSIYAAVHAVGPLASLDCIQRLLASSQFRDRALPWLRAVCADTNLVAEFLARGAAPTAELLLLLADNLEPDAVPNDLGADPWYTALETLVNAGGDVPFELQVFAFRRALGRRSRSVGELLELVFEPLHQTAEQGAFPEDQWRRLEVALPWTPFWQQWDRAIRLRRAAARKCFELDLDAETLTNLVRSDELFLQLMEEIWEIWGGLRYLRTVSSSLDRYSPRGRLLRQFLKRRSALT